jgi:hypothetical protein
VNIYGVNHLRERETLILSGQCCHRGREPERGALMMVGAGWLRELLIFAQRCFRVRAWGNSGIIDWYKEVSSAGKYRGLSLRHTHSEVMGEDVRAKVIVMG